MGLAVRRTGQRRTWALVFAIIVLAGAGRLPEGAAAGEAFQLESVRREKKWRYTDDVTIREYRQTIPWREPDPATFRWVVAQAGNVKGRRPLGLALHSWGGRRDRGWLWWFNGRPDGGGAGGYSGTTLLASDHTPASVADAGRNQYDWWTGVRLSDGKVHPVTQERLLAGLDLALKEHDGDRTRVFVWGNSMGGAGAAQMAVAYPDRFAFAISAVGLYVPHLSPVFRGSYERVWGKYSGTHPTFVENGRDVWEHFDLARRVQEEPGRDLPLIIFANGRQDKGIGWKQAVLFFRALQGSRQPHVFRWTNSGHGTRPLLPGRRAISEHDLGIDARLGRSLPAFTRCSLDNEPGNGEPSDGDASGQANLYLGWEPEGLVDEADQWQTVLWLSADAPRDQCTVDVTPRRCQVFRARPGDRFRWKAGNESGEVKADRHGLVTAPGVRVTKSGVRLTIERASRTGDRDES